MNGILITSFAAARVMLINMITVALMVKFIVTLGYAYLVIGLRKK